MHSERKVGAFRNGVFSSSWISPLSKERATCLKVWKEQNYATLLASTHTNLLDGNELRSRHFILPRSFFMYSYSVNVNFFDVISILYFISNNTKGCFCFRIGLGDNRSKADEEFSIGCSMYPGDKARKAFRYFKQQQQL